MKYNFTAPLTIYEMNRNWKIGSSQHVFIQNLSQEIICGGDFNLAKLLDYTCSKTSR